MIDDPKTSNPASAGPVRETTERVSGAEARDPVDEASWESFPAGDPPSFVHGSSTDPQEA